MLTLPIHIQDRVRTTFGTPPTPAAFLDMFFLISAEERGTHTLFSSREERTRKTGSRRDTGGGSGWRNKFHLQLAGATRSESHPMHPGSPPCLLPAFPRPSAPFVITHARTRRTRPPCFPLPPPCPPLAFFSREFVRGLEKRERQRISRDPGGSVKVLGGCLSKEPGLSAKNIYIYI